MVTCPFWIVCHWQTYDLNAKSKWSDSTSLRFDMIAIRSTTKVMLHNESHVAKRQSCRARMGMTNVGAVTWCSLVLFVLLLLACGSIPGGPQPNTSYSTQAAIDASLAANLGVLDTVFDASDSLCGTEGWCASVIKPCAAVSEGHCCQEHSVSRVARGARLDKQCLSSTLPRQMSHLGFAQGLTNCISSGWTVFHWEMHFMPSELNSW